MPPQAQRLGGLHGLAQSIAGFAADEFPPAALIATAALITTGLALLHLRDGQPTVFMAGVIVWGFAIGARPPILQARVLRLSSSSFRALAGGIVITALNLGIAAGAALDGIVLGFGQDVLILAALIAAALGIITLAASGLSQPAPIVDQSVRPQVD